MERLNFPTPIPRSVPRLSYSTGAGAAMISILPEFAMVFTSSDLSNPTPELETPTLDARALSSPAGMRSSSYVAYRGLLLPILSRR